jgi:activator of HSP90 ATPase
MAKFGEGDKRWIVEDRADGANVHNWHWAEIDCLPWSQKRLRDLLENISIFEGEGDLWMQTTTIESITGEAYVNIR